MIAIAMIPVDLKEEIRAVHTALWAPPLYWVPVRHHSPGCALALERLLVEIKPKTLLVEGPADCQSLLAACQDKATRPPVALLSQRGAPNAVKTDALETAYYPLCDYSPEWIAIQYGRQKGVQVRFIDLPYHDRRLERNEDADDRVQTLMAERHLMHSRFLQAIADRLGCRDHDEAWDRLFEQRRPDQLTDWRRFFEDVAAYCVLARRDYEPEVLEESGDQAREAFMASRIAKALKETDGPHVIVTGGFHTAALIAAVAEGAPEGILDITPAKKDANWLIRYSFDQLDALNGYGAGMPAPAYYQAVWQAFKAGGEDHLSRSAAQMLIRIAHDNRDQALSRQINPAQVQTAVVQAENLALLRGLAGPGRSEVLDAVTSCFVKEALHHSLNLMSDARRVLCGDRLGRIPDSAVQPPLVRDARQRGLALGLDFETTQVKTVTLELHRKERHRRISRYLHLNAWIGSELAQWQGGPDFVGGHQLGLMREQWRYAWTPMVEAALIGLVGQGATLERVALRRLMHEEERNRQSGQGRRADKAAALLVQACIMGLHDHAAPMAANLQTIIEQDDHLPSLVDCAFKLTTLQRGRAVLEAEKLAIDLAALIGQCANGALYQLPQLAELNDRSAEEMVPALAALNALLEGQTEEKALLWQYLTQLLSQPTCPGILRGACLGILFQGGCLTIDRMNQWLALMLQVHQPTEVSVAALQGLIQTARETLWRIPAVLDQLNRLIDAWPEDHFLSMLPSLRRLFTDLSPRETDRVAQTVAQLNDLPAAAPLIKASSTFSPREVALMPAIEAFVAEGIAQLNLEEWFEASP